MSHIVIAISTDLFPAQMRGRVMGMIQTAFAAGQVLGIPLACTLVSFALLRRLQRNLACTPAAY